MCTDGVEETIHGILRTHGPARQSHCSAAEVVAIVKQWPVHPGQWHLLLQEHNIRDYVSCFRYSGNSDKDTE